MNRTLLIGLLLLGGVAIGLFLTMPAYQEYQQDRFLLGQRAQEVKNQETYFADLASVKARLEEFPRELAKVEAALPLDPELPLFYDLLQKNAALSGMVLQSIAVSLEEAKDQPLRRISAVVEFTGSYGSLKQLLSNLNRASRAVALRAVNISGSQDQGTLKAILELKAYSY